MDDQYKHTNYFQNVLSGLAVYRISHSRKLEKSNESWKWTGPRVS